MRALEDEGVGLVEPRDAVLVENPSDLSFDGMRELGWAR
jgi:hypothetical protein